MKIIQASRPVARKVIRKNVPDIMLQKPASMVAIITNSNRRRSICAPRSVFRMMMKGAANTRNGTAAKVLGATPSWSSPKPAGRRTMAWYPLASAPASAKPINRENREFNVSGDILGLIHATTEIAPLLRKIELPPPQHP